MSDAHSCYAAVTFSKREPLPATCPGRYALEMRSWLWRGNFQLTLRLTLQGVLVGLLLGTVLAIGIVNYRAARKQLYLLESQVLAASTLGIEARIRAYFEPAGRTLLDLAERAAYNRLPIDEPNSLGMFLVDRVPAEYYVRQYS